MGRKHIPRIVRGNLYGNTPAAKECDEFWELQGDDYTASQGSRKTNSNSQRNAIKNLVKVAKSNGSNKVRVGGRIVNLDDESEDD